MKLRNKFWFHALLNFGFLSNGRRTDLFYGLIDARAKLLNNSLRPEFRPAPEFKGTCAGGVVGGTMRPQAQRRSLCARGMVARSKTNRFVPYRARGSATWPVSLRGRAFQEVG